MNKAGRRGFLLVLFILLIIILYFGTVTLRNYQRDIQMESYVFTESARELKNPGRGFYNLYRFMITDENTNYWKQVKEFYKTDEKTSLTLVEINLQNYRDGEISSAGLNNITYLFQALEDTGKQLIVRFVYDWDGENELHEPETIDIILRHMEQLEEVLREADSQIFILQGLFIGNWGEMNGTKYYNEEALLQLTEKLMDVTDPSVYLAVRTPFQWRTITGIENISDRTFRNHPFAGRLSLYNDGMLGNATDYGTYQVSGLQGEELSVRERELKFQEELCSRVPNGGEVIHDNRYNDFENAIKDLSTMHVTYLNAVHDPEVLDKWRKVKITENGCFQGMDGYTYIERHLGYRLLIKETGFSYSFLANSVQIDVTMKNVGFAPLYSEAEAGLLLYDKRQDTCLLYEMKGDLHELTGGNDSEKTMRLVADIPLDKLAHGEYEVYFFVTDLSSEQRISLANGQDAEEYGYCIGKIEL